MVYEYLLNNYKKGEPIFLSDIKIEGVSADNTRYHFKKMTNDGRLCRFETGIYFLPGKDVSGENKALTAEQVARSKYIERGNKTIGFYSGFSLANKMGISAKTLDVEEITSNKAPANMREIVMRGRKFLLRRPVVEITNDNAATLEVLECLKDIDKCAECEMEDCGRILSAYIREKKITKDLVDCYISYYPLKVYKAVYETGVYHVLR